MQAENCSFCSRRSSLNNLLRLTKKAQFKLTGVFVHLLKMRKKSFFFQTVILKKTFFSINNKTIVFCTLKVTTTLSTKTKNAQPNKWGKMNCEHLKRELVSLAILLYLQPMKISKHIFQHFHHVIPGCWLNTIIYVCIYTLCVIRG